MKQCVHGTIFTQAEMEFAKPMCNICNQVLCCDEGDSSIIEGLCSRCTLVYYDGLKEFSEDFAFAALHSQDAIRLLVLRLRVGRFHDDEDIKELLNERAAEVLERLPASFAPWWRDAWNWPKAGEMKAARKAVGWTLAALNAPILQRLAAMFAAEQDKVKEMEARHQLALQEAWEAGATEGVQDMEEVMKEKLKELEDKHAEVLANIERARKEDMEAVETRHQRQLEEAWEAGATEGVQDMEEVMKEKLEEMEAKHKKQMAAITEASAEASCAVGEAADKIRHDAKRRGYADGYAFADQKATKIIQALRADLERLSAENKALRQQIVEDKQMVQRHLKEIAKGHAEATAWEKEEIERLRKDVRAHEARVGWHADMAKRDMEEKVAEIKGLEAQVADHSRWRDEANHAASVAQLEAKTLRTKLAEVDLQEKIEGAVEEELVSNVMRSLTQKLMASNPELFGGEARGTSSPKPPAIVRLKEEVSQEGKERAMKFLKGLVPLCCSVVEESSPTPLPGIVEAEPSTEGLCRVWTAAEAPPLPLSPPPSPILVPADEPMSCDVSGCCKCTPPVEAKPKPNYNHEFWPSPTTKRFAKHLAQHSGWQSHDPKSIKTHQDALEYIAKRANISVETLLTYPMKYYQTGFAPWTLVQGGNQHFHTGMAPATWWC